jgi:hypothetical protein
MLFGLVFCISALAQDRVVPRTGFSIGLGGSYNSSNFGTQEIVAIGTSQVYENGVVVSTGTAAGPGSVDMPSELQFGPTVQAGYFRHFGKETWLWGAKLSYSYLDTPSTVQNVTIPQFGSFTNVVTNKTTPFIGSAFARSYQTRLKYQLELMPFIGALVRERLCLGGWRTDRIEYTNLYQKPDRLRPTLAESPPMSRVRRRISLVRDGWLGERLRWAAPTSSVNRCSWISRTRTPGRGSRRSTTSVRTPIARALLARPAGV